MSSVQWDFIYHNEGGVVLVGYVPRDNDGAPMGRSGVTIGAGVDLGQMTVGVMDRLAISDDLRKLIRPYAGAKGWDAVALLDEQPLTLDAEDAEVLSEEVLGSIVTEVADRYDRQLAQSAFRALHTACQTVVADIAVQYGSNLPARTPRFWGYAVAKTWRAAEVELRNFGDAYPTRRNREADLLRTAIDSGELD